MGSLAHERGGLWVAERRRRRSGRVDDLCALAAAQGLDGDAGVRRQLARGLPARGQRCARSATRASPAFAQGSSAPEHSYLKLATSELGKALYELGMELQGPYGAVVDPERGEENGRWAHAFFVSFASTIAGGSSEIQRNIIATRVLGLPRG